MWARPKSVRSTLTKTIAPAAADRHAASERQEPVAVLLVTNQFLPIVGGTEVTTLREAQALQARSHAVEVLTLRHDAHWPRSEELDGVPVRRTGGLFLGGRLRVRFGATWLAEARIWYELVRSRDSYDVVQVRQLGRLARPAVLASFVTGKPLVVRIACASAPARDRVDDHAAAGPGTPLAVGEAPVIPQARRLARRQIAPELGDVETLRRTQYLAPLTLRLLRASHVTFLALSTRIRRHLIESGFPERQLVLLPNGVDPEVYQDIAERRNRHSTAAPPACLTVVCLARLSYQKGQDVLLRAWRIVQRQMPTARLILAGNGALRPYLAQLTTELGIADSVEFAGLVNDPRPLLASAHVFVLPSRFEGMPNALLEAMAAGLPCVATRVSGSEDLIVHGHSGLLVPPEDAEALASALVRVLSDQEYAQALGRGAQTRVADAFAQDHILDELSRLYASLARNGALRQHRPRRQPMRYRLLPIAGWARAPSPMARLGRIGGGTDGENDLGVHGEGLTHGGGR